MERINASIDFDRRLYACDIAGSKAHAAMLARQGIIAKEDAASIAAGLDRILKEIESGDFEFKTSLEDIHLNVEARLAEIIGAPAGRLHTARSRNDQVATDLKLWVRDALDQLDRALQGLQAALIAKAEKHAATLMPGFTHLQTAQPVTFGHHLLGLCRDAGARPRAGCATAGRGSTNARWAPPRSPARPSRSTARRPPRRSASTGRRPTRSTPCPTATSPWSSRRSRRSPRCICRAWPRRSCSGRARSSTSCALTDAFSTGSSIMPQKRNPDAAELVRAKAGRILGALTTLVVVMKGLPLAYSKDMQEDKEPVFDTADTLALLVAAMTGMVEDMRVNTEAMRAAADSAFATATDLADWLVRELDLPFRQAHHATGAIVKLAERRGCTLADLPLEDMRKVEPRITKAVYGVLTVERSVASRTSLGGTAPANVRTAVRAAKERFL